MDVASEESHVATWRKRVGIAIGGTTVGNLQKQVECRILDCEPSMSTSVANPKGSSKRITLPRLSVTGSALRVVDVVVLLVAATVILLVARRHEPWLDEAQAWLMCRDLGFRQLFFSELRYEGNPGAWHAILWIAIHVFRAPCAVMAYLAAIPAIAGIGVLIFLAPFSRIIRYLSAFSFFVAYQYAVVARPYVLLGLFTFLAAHFYRQRFARIYSLTFVLLLLSSITVQAFLIAFGMAAGLAVTAWREWSHLDRKTKQSIWIAAGICCAFYLLLAAILWPPADLAVIGLMKRETFADHLHKLANGLTAAAPMPGWLTYVPGMVLALLQLSGWISGALLLDVLLLVSLGVVSWLRRVWLPYLISVGGLLVFYGFVYGAPHHDGIAMIALLGIFWIAAIPRGENLSQKLARWNLTATILLGLSLLVQAAWGLSSLKHDYEKPYCGATDAAKYLKSIGAETLVVYGYDPGTANGYDPGWIAIQPYFTHNLFANFRTGRTFVHHSRNIPHARGIDVEEIAKDRPDIAVVAVWIPPERFLMTGFQQRMEAIDYHVAHVSPGEMFSHYYKVQDSAFIIFRKNQ